VRSKLDKPKEQMAIRIGNHMCLPESECPDENTHHAAFTSDTVRRKGALVYMNSLKTTQSGLTFDFMLQEGCNDVN